MRILILFIPLAFLLSCSNAKVEELESEVKTLKDSIEVLHKEAEIQRAIANKMAEKAQEMADQAYLEKSRLDSLIKLQD